MSADETVLVTEATGNTGSALVGRPRDSGEACPQRPSKLQIPEVAEDHRRVPAVLAFLDSR